MGAPVERLENESKNTNNIYLGVMNLYLLAIDVNSSQVFIMPGLKVNKSEYFNRIKYPPSVYKNTVVNQTRTQSLFWLDGGLGC